MRPDPYHPTRSSQSGTGSAPADPLDRLWAATRPDEPAPALLDSLWASAARELDRIEAAGATAPDRAAILLPTPRRRRPVLAWVALAQAAVILIAVGFVFAPRGQQVAPPSPLAVRSSEPVASIAPAARPMIVVPVDQTLVVRIDRDRHEINLLTEPSAFPALPEGTPHDVYNALESMAAL